VSTAKQLCSHCGHSREEHQGTLGCKVVLEWDRLGFVKEICDCPLFDEGEEHGS
jgi:hypothetical protein